MAMNDIVLFRLEVLIETLVGKQVDVTKNPKLGEPPIGFDDVYLHGVFLVFLNENQYGFSDILKKPLTKNDFDGSTKINDLVATMLKISVVKSVDDYRTKMTERVRLGLRSIISQLASPPIAEDRIIPTHPLSEYLDVHDDSVLLKLQLALNQGLRKYLLTPMATDDLSGTVLDVQTNVVNNTIA